MKNNKPIRDDKYLIKVLQKVFRLLELYSEEVDELSVAEISERLGYNQTTVFRIIFNLEEEGYLDKNPDTGKYRLGIKLHFLGTLVRPYQNLIAVARPFISRLNQLGGETVHLAVLENNQALYLDKIEGNRTIRVVVSQVGHTLPAHCSGVGKVLLAFRPEKDAKSAIEQTGLPSYTQNTITNWNQLQFELEKVRQQGYAEDNEEIAQGLKCVAAPIFWGGRIMAAVSVSMPKDRYDSTRNETITMVKQAAEDISTSLDESLNKHQSLQEKANLEAIS